MFSITLAGIADPCHKANCRVNSGNVEVVLERDGETVQWADRRRCAGEMGIGFGRSFQCVVEENLRKAVGLWHQLIPPNSINHRLTS